MHAREPVGRVRVVDSHTEGEPTRVVLGGGPALGSGTLAERRDRFRAEHDGFRRALVAEPRGSEVAVGALLCPPDDPRAASGVIFFDNADYLGMCGHGTIGVVATLEHLGRIGPGLHRFDTPVGAVGAELAADHRVTVTNVPSFRSRSAVRVEVPGHGPVVGDVAWGGNWFFLTETAPCELRLSQVDELTVYAKALGRALRAGGIAGSSGEPIQHIEISGPPSRAGLDSRNFVLCPGGMYDRSPCGTGTSAKLACLRADGRLGEGEVWRQESITGTTFDAWYVARGERIEPHLRGRAYVTAELDFLLDDSDPYGRGFPG